MDEEVMPLPRPLMTPPVTITYFMMGNGCSNMLKHRCGASFVNRPPIFHPEDVDHLITIVDGIENSAVSDPKTITLVTFDLERTLWSLLFSKIQSLRISYSEAVFGLF